MKQTRTNPTERTLGAELSTRGAVKGSGCIMMCTKRREILYQVLLRFEIDDIKPPQGGVVVIPHDLCVYVSNISSTEFQI